MLLRSIAYDRQEDNVMLLRSIAYALQHLAIQKGQTSHLSAPPRSSYFGQKISARRHLS